jgi:hypothetical protein
MIMANTRKIRIEYYRVVVAAKKGIPVITDKLFNLEKVINIADSKTLEDITLKYYQEEARLDKIKFDSSSGYWFLNFVRLRQTKIPSKAERNKPAVPIKLAFNEYIGEDVTALYDVTNHILALQRNRDSLSATGIESYLSELYNSPNYDIYLRPIKPMDLDERLNDAKIFRKLTMRFADIPKGNFRGDRNSSFYQLIKYFGSFSAQTAVLSVSLGHKRKKSLDSETIHETLNILKDNFGLIDAAELSVKSSEVDPVDTIDLFTDKSHDFVSIKVEKLETIDYLDLANEILLKYAKSKEKLLKSLEG